MNIELLIRRALLIGVLSSLVLVSMGGFFYLAHHGGDVVNYQHFQSEPQYFKSIPGLFTSGYFFTALGLIYLGIAILVFTQFIRVILTGCLFASLHDKKFVAITLGVLLIMIFSIL